MIWNEFNALTLSMLSYLFVESNIVRLIIFVQIDKQKKTSKIKTQTNKQTNKSTTLIRFHLSQTF
jgi:hypothetical protein